MKHCPLFHFSFWDIPYAASEDELRYHLGLTGVTTGKGKGKIELEPEEMDKKCSCITAQPNTAKLIDLHRGTLRLLPLPTTAADLMLEQPGRLVSPVSHLRRDRRFSAIKADDILVGGGIYVLIPVSRVNGRVADSEMAAIESFCSGRRSKRRSSRVLPVVADQEGCDRVLGEAESEVIGRRNHRVKQWKPALEPIHEGI
ncbi:hypothetical protein SASPL_104296 [Salvia splendens]|uniref:Uncharacterized protein n=1 Tax=Salvia splendens TaxID=180675 RepID=A0A8X8YHP9_SALSN|nr:hypothetical protein SASPL_104296 [Salvia splendens]